MTHFCCSSLLEQTVSPWDAFVPIERGANGGAEGLGPKRRVYMCYVLGSRGSGKTAFLRCLAQKKFCPEYTQTDEAAVVACRAVVEPDSESDFAHYRYLCATEFENEERAVHIKRVMRKCDVAVLLTDLTNPYSFGYALSHNNYI